MIKFLYNFETIIIIIANVLMLVLGYVVYRNNTKNYTNIFLFVFTLLSFFWGISLFLTVKIDNPNLFFIFLKIVLFIALLINFFTYLISITYPTYKIDLKSKELLFLFSIILLTDFVILLYHSGYYYKEISIDVINNILKPIFIFFGIISMFMNVLATKNLIQKFIKSDVTNRVNYVILILGFTITFLLIITFTYIFPNFFKDIRFLPYGALFMFPFIISVSYGIIRFKFLNIRLTTSVIFIVILLLLAVVSLFEAGSLLEIVFRLLILVGLIILSFLLINYIYSEMEYREKLEELNRLKSEFLSFASHQVKSPMTNIKGFIDLILDGIYGDVNEKVKEILNKIKKNIDEEIDLVNNLLDLRKIEEGRMEYNFTKFDILELIKEVCDFYKIRALEKGLFLDCKIADEKIFLNGDKEKLKQVFSNLVDNAIKYTNNGFVEVAVFKSDNKVIVKIKDTGIGIKPEILRNLFQQFIRDPSIKKVIKGTGLGLFIAKEIVEAHQGKIWAESEGEGMGSIFYVELPIVKENSD